VRPQEPSLAVEQRVALTGQRAAQQREGMPLRDAAAQDRREEVRV